MEVMLDCRKLTDRTATHAYLKEQFGFPDYYGNNLDALYDCLMELSDTEIHLQTPEALSQLGHYSALLMDTLRDAVQNNPTLTLVQENNA